MFSAPTKDKTTLFTMFFLLSQPQNRTETSVFTMFLQHQKSQRSQNAVFYSVFGTPFQKHWYLQCFVKTHARNTVNTNEFKDYIFHGNKPQTAKTLLFTAFLRNDFSKKTCFLDRFWRLKPPKTKRGVPPHPPSTS